MKYSSIKKDKVGLYILTGKEVSDKLRIPLFKNPHISEKAVEEYTQRTSGANSGVETWVERICHKMLHTLVYFSQQA